MSSFQTPTRLVNLTPHDCVIMQGGGDDPLVRSVIPTHGAVMRVQTGEQRKLGELCPDVPIFSPPEFSDELDWPALDADVDAVLVSLLVGQAAKRIAERGYEMPYAVYVPDTGPASAVRDEDGGIVGVRRLVLYARRRLAVRRREAHEPGL